MISQIENSNIDTKR